MINTNGSLTAKGGFKNEREVAEKFNNWQTDKDAQAWLKTMSYNLEQIESVEAVIISGHKADLHLRVYIKLKDIFDIENIQIKLVSNDKGFNQIDKRWLKSYKTMWNIPEDVYKLLQYFTGELLPYRSDTKDSRRMFVTEFTEVEQELLIKWFEQYKVLITSDIIRGRGKFSAEWILVIQKTSKLFRWTLKNINEVLQHYSQTKVVVSPKGSINFGKIGIQRKGGDGGADSANMLQFKLDPTELFEI
jgi:hypothetical protein